MIMLFRVVGDNVTCNWETWSLVYLSCGSGGREKRLVRVSPSSYSYYTSTEYEKKSFACSKVETWSLRHLLRKKRTRRERQRQRRKPLQTTIDRGSTKIDVDLMYAEPARSYHFAGAETLKGRNASEKRWNKQITRVRALLIDVTTLHKLLPIHFPPHSTLRNCFAEKMSVQRNCTPID